MAIHAQTSVSTVLATVKPHTLCNGLSAVMSSEQEVQVHIDLRCIDPHPMQINGYQDMDMVFNDITKAMDSALAKIDPMEAFCADAPSADECRVYSD